jgi:vitamin B12 transporter
MKRLAVILAVWALAAFGGSVPAAAQDRPATMAEVVVTATRTETTLDKVGGSAVSVVTTADIEAAKQTRVAEALKGIPGIDIVTSGGPGATTTIFIRGGDSKNTLVLVDGIMFNDPSSPNRSADLANLTLDNIERIEVVRGPLSALYGSNATAGVINIITKKGSGQPTAHVGAEYGSYDTWKVFGDASGQLRKFNFSLAAARTETDGFSAANDRNSDIPRGGNTAEDDGWENTTLSGKFGLDITDNFDVNAVVRYIDSTADIDDFNGFAADRWNFNTFPAALEPDGSKSQGTENDQLFYQFNVHNYFFDRRVESTLFYKGADQDNQTYDADDDRINDLEGRIAEAGWQGSLMFTEINTLSLGYTYFEEKLEENDSDQKKADINSYWVSDQLFLLDDRLVVVGGVRIDDHSRFGTETTWQVAPSYLIKKTDTTIKASYGTGFRAPSLYELFAEPILSFGFLGGNEDLDAEKSRGWDAGFEQRLLDGSVKFGATYFATRYRDKIEFVYDPAAFTSTYENLDGTTKTQGVETFAEWSPIETLSLLLNYTYTDTEDPDGEELVRRPQNRVYFNARYRCLQRLTLNLDAYWVDDRKTIAAAVDADGNRVEDLDAYYLVNLAAAYDINDHVQLYGRIDNLFDEYYEQAWSYATPGLSGHTGVKFTF